MSGSTATTTTATNKMKAPSWLARMQTIGQQQQQAESQPRLDSNSPKQTYPRDTFRPTHKRSESLATMKDFLIYNNELERAAPCDKTGTTTTIKKLVKSGNNNNNDNKDGDHQHNNNKIHNDNKDSNTNDGQHRRRNAGNTQATTGNHYLLDEGDNESGERPKRALVKFRLKSLLVRPFNSLTISSCLLLLTLAIVVERHHQPAAGSLVIHVDERPPGAHGTHHHHDQYRPRRSYVIVSGSTTTNGTRSKRASDSKLERSAKLLEVDALNYLQRYGYMNSSGSQSGGGPNAINIISEDSFHEAVMQFQRFAGIPETGSVDSLTVRYMQMPRCGNKDLSGKGENGKRRRKRRKRRRRKRYALQGSKWRRQELSYRISQYPTRFLSKKHEVDTQIERAFKIWSQVAPIDFVVKREGRVHIDIRFASGEHGDGDPFDGPGNTLAHAYFPQYGGDAHFDDQEYWTVDSYAGTNIFQVAAHELGHSLGLGHSSVREALMAPFYQKYKPNFKLHADDVLAIQALYGERGDGDESPSTTSTSTTESSAPPPRRRPAPTDDPDEGGGGFFGGGTKPVDLCQDPKIDAITRTEDGNTYVFRGQHYWQIKNEGLASGSPGKIARDWDGLPGNLDAALTWSDGKTFFFKGDKYWRYFNKRREPGYPKLISVGFAGIPSNVNAAFVWSGNGKTYFFKGDKYWRFDSKQEPPVSGQYPKPVKNWSGLPAGGVDAAFKWENGITYFFKDELYYRFDDREFEVDSSARPAFPRSTAEWWFGCTNSNLPIRRVSPGGGEAMDDGTRPGNDIEPSESSQTQSGAADSSSLLLFHRKPNLAYDSSSSQPTIRQAGGGGGFGSGGSISRSIISSLSALFPSSSSQDERSNSSGDPDDWSFHRGLGEEVRRLMKGARSASNEGGGDSRWSFPLGSNQSGGGNNRNGGASREQSMSELRMMTPALNHAGRRATAALANDDDEEEKSVSEKREKKEEASVVTRATDNSARG